MKVKQNCQHQYSLLEKYCDTDGKVHYTFYCIYCLDVRLLSDVSVGLVRIGKMSGGIERKDKKSKKERLGKHDNIKT